MLSGITDSLIQAIRASGPKSVFWGGVIEQVISPIPSVLIPMGAGAILIPAQISFSIALLQVIKDISIPYALGATIGSSVLFLIAYKGGPIFIEKFGKFFDLSLGQIDKFRKKFTRGFKDELIILGLLMVPVTPISIVAASCGLIGIKPKEFFPLVLVGTFFRSIILGLIGWKMGETYMQLASGLNKTESLITASTLGVIFLVMAYLYYRRMKFFKK